MISYSSDSMLLSCSLSFVLLLGMICCNAEDHVNNNGTLTFDPRLTSLAPSLNTSQNATTELPRTDASVTSTVSPPSTSSVETTSVTSMKTEVMTTPRPTVNVSTTVKAAEVVPAPEHFEAILLKNRTVYLSWTDLHHSKAIYQIFMAYGNHRQLSKFLHMGSTSSAEESFKLDHLLSHVTGNATITFLKFRVRTAFARGVTSDFTREVVIGLPKAMGSTGLRNQPRINREDYSSSVWKFVVPVVVLLVGAILTLIGVYTYKQVRFKRRYQYYMRTHYETDSEAVSVSNDNFDFDQPQHLTFGDNSREEDHLVIA